MIMACDRGRRGPASVLRLLMVTSGLALAAAPAAAQVFRCLENGRPVFQDTPCPDPRAAPPAARPADESRWPYGCYELRATAGTAENQAFRILSSGGRPVIAFREKGAKPELLALRPASVAELEQAAGGGRMEFEDGYVLSEFAGKGEKPIGLFRQGRTLFGYFFVANGPVSRVDCRGW